MFLKLKEDQIEMEFYNCKQERIDGVLERHQERMEMDFENCSNSG
jgi:hypothetical protein